EGLDTILKSLTGEVYASSQALSFQQAQVINRSLSNRVDALSRSYGPGGLWIDLLGADGRLHQPGYSGGDTHLFGAQWGADARLNPDVVLGAAFSWSEASAVFDGLSGRSKGQSRGLSLYGRYGAPTGAYLSARIGHDW